MNEKQGALEVETVPAQWFQEHVLSSGWSFHPANADTFEAERNNFPRFRFRLYKVGDGAQQLQGTWAVSSDLLIQEHEGKVALYVPRLRHGRLPAGYWVVGPPRTGGPEFTSATMDAHS